MANVYIFRPLIHVGRHLIEPRIEVTPSLQDDHRHLLDSLGRIASITAPLDADLSIVNVVIKGNAVDHIENAQILNEVKVHAVFAAELLRNQGVLVKISD